MKRPIKTYMIGYLAVLLALSALMVGQLMRIAMGAVIIIIYIAADLLVTYIKKSIRQDSGKFGHSVVWWYVPSSSVISALILSLVFDTARHPWLALIAPVIAVATKQFLHFGRPRHLANPAAFSMVVISLFAPVVAWWGPSSGTVPLVAVALSGLYILYRIKRYPTAIVFLVTYLVLLVVVSLIRGVEFRSIPTLLAATFFDGTLLFFTTVMLIEPVTTSYPKPRERTLFGALVGVLALVISLIPRIPPLGAMDPLLLALVVGNIVVGLRTYSPSRL